MKQNDQNFLRKRMAKKKNAGSQPVTMAPKVKEIHRGDSA